jgi:predicted PurR-regulated permease PerM
VERLGVVTASLAFFRSIGGVVGVAVLGSIMANRMTSEFQAGIATLPPAVAGKLGGIAANPQALMDPASQQAMQSQLATLGPSAQQVAAQVTSILRDAVAAAVTEVFVIGSVLIAVAFATSFFLREIPLRTTRHPITEELEELGIEFGAGVGEELQTELVADATGMAPSSTVGNPSVG